MIYIILLFSLICSFKTIVVSEFYSNFLIFSLYPLELALLSFNNSYSDIVIKWIMNGWLRQGNDIQYISNIQDYNDYVIMVSWGATFTLVNIYILLKYKKEINKFIYISYMLKFLIINYISLFLWSFNILLNYDHITYFVVLLLNVFIFNFITFWFPGLLFNYVYGDKLYLYRKKYNFLIDYYHPKYKYFTLILQALKSINFLYMLIYNYYNEASNYILLSINLINIIIYLKLKKIFNMQKLNFYLIVLHSFSILLIIESIIDDIYIYNYIIKYTLLILNFIFLILFNFKQRRMNLNEREEELDNYNFENIEMNIII